MVLGFTRQRNLASGSDSPQHKCALQSTEELHEAGVVAPPFAGGRGLDRAEGQRLGLHLQVGFGVDVGRAEGDMAEPGADGVDVHAGAEQVRRRGVPEGVWTDAFSRERRHHFRRHEYMAFDDGMDAETGERLI